MPDSPPQETRPVARQKWMQLRAGFNDEPYIVVNPGVMIVPMNYAGEVLFTFEPTIPGGLAARVLTLPGGVIDPGETPAQAANRELQEEIGFRAEVLFPLGVITPLVRHSQWDVSLFLARNLVPARKIGDEVYQVETQRAPFEDLETLIAAGRLRDATVIAALFLARQFIAGKFSPGSEDTDHA